MSLCALSSPLRLALDFWLRNRGIYLVCVGRKGIQCGFLGPYLEKTLKNRAFRGILHCIFLEYEQNDIVLFTLEQGRSTSEQLPRGGLLWLGK
jgi:hypothetical protein